jgi:dihydroflavonol-4-reductase
VPLIELDADVDDETLSDAIGGVEVIVFAAQTAAPGNRIRFRRSEPHTLARVVNSARRSRVRRIVHVSTGDVLGSDHFARVTEKSKIKPTHAFEKQKLFEEEWLLANAGAVEVVVIRPARVFGEGEDWMLPRLMAAAVRGRVWLPGGGRAKQTFVSGEDVGRACLAASDRGRPGHRYLVGGFDSSWRDYLLSAARAVGFAAEIASIPYDLAYARALAAEAITPQGAAVWPGLFGIDVLGKPHQYDDSYSRRELTWSPSVGSFEQGMPAMAPWLSALPAVAAALRESPQSPAQEAISPPGR